ncbi:hypothetical protein [Microcystis aeruginosa]|nr:hypothetical protein [Microcystis aeruginosa]MCZ8121092.1 hypothetical protein [Microcystis sp. LE18-22.4A]MDJ0670188.1 hypothetical protein [Microcystis sp. M53598_WE2]
MGKTPHPTPHTPHPTPTKNFLPQTLLEQSESPQKENFVPHH